MAVNVHSDLGLLRCADRLAVHALSIAAATPPNAHPTPGHSDEDLT